jgi:hypothetical protein
MRGNGGLYLKKAKGMFENNEKETLFIYSVWYSRAFRLY